MSSLILIYNLVFVRCESLMSKLHVTSEGTIEDIGDGLLQAWKLWIFPRLLTAGAGLFVLG